MWVTQLLPLNKYVQTIHLHSTPIEINVTAIYLQMKRNLLKWAEQQRFEQKGHPDAYIDTHIINFFTNETLEKELYSHSARVTVSRKYNVGCQMERSCCPKPVECESVPRAAPLSEVGVATLSIHNPALFIFAVRKYIFKREQPAFQNKVLLKNRTVVQKSRD